MASSALIASALPVLKQLAPVAKQIAVLGGKAAWRAIKRRRRSRQRRGKRVIGGRIERAIRAARASNSTRAIPVRRNVTTQDRGKILRINDLDACSVQIPLGPDNTTGAASYLVSPIAQTIWPKVVDKAPQYQEYDVDRLVFEYIPVVGSAVNGQVYVSFIPQTETQTTFNYDEIQSHEFTTSFTVSEPKRFIVPSRAMCQNGTGLFIPNIPEAVGEPTRYYMGMLNVVAINVTAGITAVGNFRCHYGVTLKRPQLDTVPSTAVYDAVNDEIDRAGRCQLSKNPAGYALPPLSFGFAGRRHGILLLHATTNAAVTAAVDGGAPLAATFTADDGAAHFLHYFDLGRAPGYHICAVTGATLTWARIIEDDVATY